MTTDGWQLEGASPELYQRYLVPAVTLPWAIDLVDRVGIRPGDRVLDVACGTGVVARVAAERAGDSGRVAGLDVNGGMLGVARSLPPPAGAPVEWVEGSAHALPFPEDAFDVGLCQLGLQFVPDPAAALRELRRVLAQGGRAAVSVFSAIERNPAPQALTDALDRLLGAGASVTKRNEHSLADVEELHVLFASAGFGDARIETVVRMVRFESVAEYVRIQFAATPLADLLAGRDVREQRRLVDLVTAEVSGTLAGFAGPDGLDFPQEVHVALARA